MKKLLQFIIIFLFFTSVHGQIQPYYEGIDFNKTEHDLFLELSTRIQSTHSGIPYTSSSTDVWDACELADEDPDISSNVLLIYGFNDSDSDTTNDRTRDKSLHDGGGGTFVWNREHVFAKSLASPSLSTGEPGPGTDVHNLRPADSQRNSSRSNRKFTDGNGDSGIASNGGWYPGDEWKGDVARIVMYMYLRYNGDGSKISETNCSPINIGFGTALTVDSKMIDLFLKWNVEDPVSTFEANRNEALFSIQKNRNPFIDNPYLATLIWNGLAAEDRWDMDSNTDNESPSIPTNLVASNISDESFDINWSASTDNIAVYDYLVYLNDVYVNSTSSTSISISNLNSSTGYNVKIKARDAASNYSDYSEILNVETLEGPKILFSEDFEDCDDLNFVAYSEASDKDWACNIGMFGENNSGSYGINGYQEDVPSKDWLLTKNSIDFDIESGENLSFYTDAAYGTSPLDLVYSSEYQGSGDPGDFTWIAVPNISTLVHNNSSTETVYSFSDVDISEISGKVYFAFKYYSNGAPTRWTVDSFEISVENNDDPDLDGDGVLNENDLCPNTEVGESVDLNGCSNGQLDDDNDGVSNSEDSCSDTLTGEDVNDNGCSQSQLDDDDDGVMNDIDICSNTPTGEAVNETGCSNGQLDDDNDGVSNSEDSCSETPTGEDVNDSGCSQSQLDDDEDGVMNNIDTCSNTPIGEVVNETGCSNGQLDDDNDGVSNSEDSCSDTPTGEDVDENGCSQSQLDDDEDGVMNNVDSCINTPIGEDVNEDGCSESQLDDDNDGVMNDKDLCPNSTVGTTVDENGCFVLPTNNFSIETISETCPNKNNGQIRISVEEIHSYNASIGGVEYDFTNELNVEDLSPGTYDICINISSESYVQCYTINIEEGSTISGKSVVSSKNLSIEIEKGSSPFSVYLNGIRSFETNASQFNLDVNHGDLVEVKTAVVCEGIYSKRIELLGEMVAYPNPTSGDFYIKIPSLQSEVIVELFSIHSQLIFSKNYPVSSGKVRLSLTDLPIGIYLAKVYLDEPVTIKIIKD